MKRNSAIGETPDLFLWRFCCKLSCIFYTNFFRSSSGIALDGGEKCNFRTIYTGRINFSTSKNFHGPSSAGGSPIKRIRSLVTG